VSQAGASGRGRSWGAGSTVLRSKLRPPTAPDRLVLRSRLHQLLDDVIARPLTLVVAPAGSGKTSLLATWCAELSTPYAWLSVDEDDRDTVQFWSGMALALETLAPGSGQRARALVTRPNALLDGVAALLDDLEAAPPADAILVIDDLHVIDGDELAVRSLSLFFQHLPGWLHVVMAARRSPGLPLDRLRARGQLGEIHFAELKFSEDEAVQLVKRLAPTLEDHQLTEIVGRAGGWAAGIQLAALAARVSHAQLEVVAHGSEGDLLVEDYVWHEVLASEDPDLVDSLLDIAVVELVDRPLAIALTGREDASSQLNLAETRGLFVSRSDSSGRYFMHSLVREVLLAELARRSPDRLARQHVRAARWYEEHGQVPQALEHWLLGGYPREALRLLAADVTALYDGGREATIARTLRRIPTQIATSDLTAIMEVAWCYLLVNRQRFLDAVDQMSVIARASEDIDTTSRARMTMLQSIAATLQGDWDKGAALAGRALGDLGDRWWLDPLGKFSWNMLVRGTCLSERWDDDNEEVRAARRALSIEPERVLSFEGIRALGEALAGRPVDALRVAAGIRNAADVANMTILRAELSMAEALAHREMGDLPRALDELSALADFRVEATPYCQLLACVELGFARCDAGDVARAELWFARAADLVEKEYAGRGGRGWLARLGVRLALAGGALELAKTWSGQIDDPFWTGVSRARVFLAEGDHAQAASALHDVTPRCVRHEVVRDLLRARTAQGHNESLKWVIAAVDLASVNGLLQTVASEGPEVMRLVELVAWRVPPSWLDRLRRRATVEVGPGTVEALRGMVDQLTDREREVLRLLPSRLTLREIAAELFISMNTLKFHLKVIYRKLHCGSRAEAADVARALTQLKRADQGPSTLRR
jgi:LuxR family transcriptional regulator, maltose regulon positive regulatory protein